MVAHDIFCRASRNLVCGLCRELALQSLSGLSARRQLVHERKLCGTILCLNIWRLVRSARLTVEELPA